MGCPVQLIGLGSTAHPMAHASEAKHVMASASMNARMAGLLFRQGAVKLFYFRSSRQEIVDAPRF
jgi:hypothetical protein